MSILRGILILCKVHALPRPEQDRKRCDLQCIFVIVPDEHKTEDKNRRPCPLFKA